MHLTVKWIWESGRRIRMKNYSDVAHEGLFCTECEKYEKCNLECNDVRMKDESGTKSIIDLPDIKL